VLNELQAQETVSTPELFVVIVVVPFTTFLIGHLWYKCGRGHLVNGADAMRIGFSPWHDTHGTRFETQDSALVPPTVISHDGGREARIHVLL
jgi:hypothetical protein